MAVKNPTMQGGRWGRINHSGTGTEKILLPFSPNCRTQMYCRQTIRGFNLWVHPKYPPAHEGVTFIRLVQESSAIADYADALENPGSSYLWISEDLHLDREDVAKFISLLQHWLDHKRLPSEIPVKPPG
jgi:hypothetical protein